jgi:hypothetical protein
LHLGSLAPLFVVASSVRLLMSKMDIILNKEMRLLVSSF